MAYHHRSSPNRWGSGCISLRTATDSIPDLSLINNYEFRHCESMLEETAFEFDEMLDALPHQTTDITHDTPKCITCSQVNLRVAADCLPPITTQ